MKQLKRTLPYGLRYTKAAALDVVEAHSDDATVNKGSWQIIATVKVYGNESRIALELSEAGENISQLHIKMTAPAPNLSGEGQERALRFLADSMEQLLENVLTEPHEKENAI